MAEKNHEVPFVGPYVLQNVLGKGQTGLHKYRSLYVYISLHFLIRHMVNVTGVSAQRILSDIDVE